MDPTTAIPLHFTLQAIGVASGGLLLAWALVRRRWFGALGAAMLATGEGLHAGRYLATDDDPALVVLRFAGVGLLTVAAVRVPVRRVVYLAGAAFFVGGTVWAAAIGGGLASPTVGPHTLTALGMVALALWVTLESRDSVRLRVLTALVAMLAIAVVVGGGAVSRVAALDKRNEQLRQLGSAATATRAELNETINGLARRAALLSPLLADDISRQGEITEVRDALQAGVAESIAVLARDGGPPALFTTSVSRRPAYPPEKVTANPAVRLALDGAPASDYDVDDGRLVLVSAGPIYAPGSTRELLGAVVLLQSRAPTALRAGAREYAPGTEIVIVGRTTVTSDRLLLGIEPARNETDQVVFGRLDVADETRPAATALLTPSTVRLVVVGSDAGTVAESTGLLRALLIAILASALVAVIAALWLSSRVTRPILDLAAGAERVKADFLSSLSHELRTPLTPIRGYTEILRRGRVPARRAEDYLDEIGQAAGRLERIVTLLLDVAALEAGRFRVDASDLRPTEILEAAAERWRGRSSGHSTRVAAPKALPRVRADSDALARVLDELVDNAIKFSPDGGPVELRARRAGDGIEISVSDEGIGLSAEAAGELTAAFAQMDSGDRRRFGGLGLGLTYVSGVLRAHGSRLFVASRPEGGTTFSFTLPAAGMVNRMRAEDEQTASQRRESRQR